LPVYSKTIVVDRVEDIEKTLAHLLPEMTANLFIPVAMIIWMLVINIKLTVIIFLWIVFGLSIGMLMMIGYKKKYEGQVQAQKSMPILPKYTPAQRPQTIK